MTQRERVCCLRGDINQIRALPTQNFQVPFLFRMKSSVLQWPQKPCMNWLYGHISDPFSTIFSCHALGVSCSDILVML